MNKIVRKNKSILIDKSNEDNIIKVAITIESNHIKNNLDQYLDLLTSNVKTLNNYSLKEDLKAQEEKPNKTKKNKAKFSSSIYV